MLTDENAFGLLVAFHDIENAEYALEPEAFVERFDEFRSTTLAYATESPLGSGARILDFGHALYFEIADGDHGKNPIEWLKALTGVLRERSFEVASILSHGGRWVDASDPEPAATDDLPGGYSLLRVARPSEPLRRALHAETATHAGEGVEGWGGGLYVDTEAIEALGKSLKNAPTALSIAGATFYRIGK